MERRILVSSGPTGMREWRSHLNPGAPGPPPRGGGLRLGGRDGGGAPAQPCWLWGGWGWGGGGGGGWLGGGVGWDVGGGGDERGGGKWNPPPAGGGGPAFRGLCPGPPPPPATPD